MRTNIKFKRTITIIQVALILLILSSCTSLPVENPGKQTINLELDMEDDLIKISEILTYEDIIDSLKKDEGISEAQLKQIIDENQYNSKTFRIISNYISTDPNHLAEIKFYCETVEEISNRSIINIFYVKVDSEGNNEKSFFNGDIFIHFLTDNKIYYILNGDFYKNGKYTERDRLNIEEGEHIKININLEDISDQYYYIHKENHINF